MRLFLAALLLAAAPGGPDPAFAQEEEAYTAHDFLKRGTRRRMRGEYTNAIYDYSEAIRLDDNIPGLHMARGMAYLDRALREGRWDTLNRAEEDFERAVYADINNGRAYALRGFVRALRGNQRGIGDVRRAQQIDSALPPEGFAALGIFAMDAGAWEQAKLFLKKGISIVAPGFPIRGWMRKKLQEVETFSRRRIRTSLTRRRDDDVDDADSLRGLLLQMIEGDDEAREEAARLLAIPGDESAYGALVRALEDPALRVRAQAAASLGKMELSKASKALLPHLDAEDRRFRGVVVRALGDVGSERAKVPLEKRLKSEDEKAIRKEIRLSLKKIDEAAFTMKMDLEYMFELVNKADAAGEVR
jgi:tetratricopeptide (TPR) repeat protein